MSEDIDKVISERVAQVKKDIEGLEALAKEHGKEFSLRIGLNFGARFEEITIDEDYGIARTFYADDYDEEHVPEHEWGWNAWLPSSAYC